jgi:NAD(P)-dependent dehydrogenase (short-subunit alcohol dehydrogenase family)
MSGPKVWFITGANRGIGAEIAKAALAAGHNVIATARKQETVEAAVGTSDALLALALDITDEQQSQDAVDAAVSRFGRIDVLVNNAGYGQSRTSPGNLG